LSSFSYDLQRGLEYEEKHLQLLRKKHPDIKKIEGYCKEYDLFCPSTNIGFEVKYDLKSLQTGNIIIETEMPIGTPSGLSTTKAFLWIFDTSKESFYVKVDDLKKLVKPMTPRIIPGPGDTHKKLAYLVKKKEIENISFDYLNKKDLNHWL
jgi:hypothetical protein